MNNQGQKESSLSLVERMILIGDVLVAKVKQPKNDWWPTVKDGDRIHRSDTNLIYQYDEATNTWFIVED